MFNIGIANDGYVTTKNTEDGPIQVWVNTYSIMATSPEGRVFVLGSSENLNHVQKELALLNHNPDTNPDVWLECDPLYGSEAWDDEAERALAVFEADKYNEPRPSWA